MSTTSTFVCPSCGATREQSVNNHCPVFACPTCNYCGTENAHHPSCRSTGPSTNQWHTELWSSVHDLLRTCGVEPNGFYYGHEERHACIRRIEYCIARLVDASEAVDERPSWSELDELVEVLQSIIRRTRQLQSDQAHPARSCIDADISWLEELDRNATPGPVRLWSPSDHIRCAWREQLPQGSFAVESTGTVWAFGKVVAAFPDRPNAELFIGMRNLLPSILSDAKKWRNHVDPAHRSSSNGHQP